jgi:hypothetical protein
MSYKMIITISVVSRVATPLEVSHEDRTPIPLYRPWPALHPQRYLAYVGHCNLPFSIGWGSPTTYLSSPSE